MNRAVSGLLAAAAVGACSRPAAQTTDPTAARVERIVAGLRPAVVVNGRPPAKYELAQRMQHYKLPGVSIAVADSGRIVWAGGFGVKEAGTSDSVTPTTLFEAGSISKPVAATAMLRLVQEGKLDLDTDVNTYLKSWKVPENRFTARERVTLRRIVSHNAGLTVHGFPGYKTTDSIPTVPQLLDGAKPANTGPVRVDTLPGAIWRYSGGGTTVMQLLLADVTGESFPALSKRLVLDPAGMANSTYEQPLPPALHQQASAAHGPDGAMLPGRWHIYPEMAAAGLWTTPTDLLQWAIAIANARAGTSDKLLAKDIATQMLTVQKAATGLGPFLEGSGRGFNFGHGGSDEGFHAQLIYFPETGQGAAVMVNSDGGQSMLQEVVYAVAAEYGWPDYGPREITAIPVDSVAMDRFVGTYELTKPFPVTITVSREGTRLVIESRFTGESEAIFTTPDRVTVIDAGFDFEFMLDDTGRATAIGAEGIKALRKK